MNISIFLGAGASAAEHCPIQNQLFSEYFNKLGVKDFENDMNIELHKFFKEMFNIDVVKDDISKAHFPTFEEVLGLLDLAEQRREAFKNFGLESLTIGNRNDSIRFLRQYLILLMAKTLHKNQVNALNYHYKLLENLEKVKLLENTTFISANYDIHVDNAIAGFYKDEKPYMLDYGVEFTNFDHHTNWKRAKDPKIKLYKIHGSLNWLYCPVCNSLTLTPYESGIIRLIDTIDESRCLECNEVTVPIIIPPTYFKNMTNSFISTIWNEVEKTLRQSDVLVFCGYSFAAADIHIKYMLKRVQTSRQKNKLKIIVFNYYKGKKSYSMTKEERRYKRFLGEDVIFTHSSFEDFTLNPSKFIYDAVKLN